MDSLKNKIEQVNWNNISIKMHEKGYVIIPNFLPKKINEELISLYNNPDGYRKTVKMERFRFGKGEYKYFDYPLPATIKFLRENIHPKLVPIANLWMKVLKVDKKFPATFKDLQQMCHNNGQKKQQL